MRQRDGASTLRAFERWVKCDPYLVRVGANRSSQIFLRAARVVHAALRLEVRLERT